MPVNVVYTGDLAALEKQFLSSLARSLANNPMEPHVALCGSHLLGTYLRRQAAQSGTNLFNVRFHTFDTLAADLLPPDYRKRKLISPLGELVLLKGIVQSQPGYFDPVREKSGLLFALLAAVQDLIDGG
ncbi:MAG: hypothetical protein HYX74_11670, partial [Acidobacteria bacterium]|nr:hypothetical protein [Acidobacteriota bacterium]